MWLENFQEMDNIIYIYGLYFFLEYKNLIIGLRCLSFFLNFILIIFDCDVLFIVVCQLKYLNIERGKGQFGCFSYIEIRIRFYFY